MTTEILDPETTGYYARRNLADGRKIFVFPLTYGRARIGIGDDYTFDNVW